jgi:riboflavin-specific deaminase-like protein
MTLCDDWPRLWADMLDIRRAAAPGFGLIVRREAGWQLQGAWPEADAGLFALYKPLLDAISARTPFCIAQLGQSLDGCVATRSGDSCFVTGPQSLLHLHRLRALCDAVLVGAGTVAADDPQLTTRRVPGPHAMRVVLDPAVRLDGRARVLRDGQAQTLWLCDARHCDIAQARLGMEAGTTEVLGIEGLLDADTGFRPEAVVNALATRGLQRLFVEGGGVTVSRFLAAGQLDRLHLMVAPVLIGSGRPGLQLAPWSTMKDCPRPPARTLALGDDMLWDLDLRGAQPPIQTPR